ncbi:MAG: hypothetical protein FJ027_19910 [Candidatus Rokubacteria bacterium]|nr:hypothetical protein [Candidatus Rokubacteria bacterium]
MTGTSRLLTGVLIAAAVVAGGCTGAGRDTAGGRTPAQLAVDRQDAEGNCPRRPDYQFWTDGCSMFPDGGWQQCCVDHDKVYWCGGTADTREKADAALRACVVKTSSPLLGALMYRGVRLGGVPWLPVPWRWGYGWRYPRPYDAP